MTLRTLVVGLSLSLCASSLGLAGCGGEDEPAEEQEQGHDPQSASCAAIMDVCHAADEGSGPAHDCHDIAHHDVEADCAAQKDSCIATCEDVLDGDGM